MTVPIPIEAPEHEPLTVASDVLKRWADEHREEGTGCALAAANLIDGLTGRLPVAS
jgi:hypothetical protein